MAPRNTRRRHPFARHTTPTGSHPPQLRLVPAVTPASRSAAPPPLTLTPIYRYLIMLTLVLGAVNLTLEITALPRSTASAPANRPDHPALSRRFGFGPIVGVNLPTNLPMGPPPTAVVDGTRALRPADAVPGCRPQAI